MEDIYRSFQLNAGRVSDHLARYLQRSHNAEVSVLNQMPLAELAQQLKVAHWIRQGGIAGEHLDTFLDTYLRNTTHLHHPGFMAHQVSTPHVAASLGAMVDAFTNNGMNIYEMGPAGATLEYTLVNWMLEKVGWQTRPWPHELCQSKEHGGGTLTHGGSLANLTALLAARAQAFPDAWVQGSSDGAILAPPCHYSIKRAAGIMGMGTNAVFDLPCDPYERILPDQIETIWQRARDQGKKPFALVANACSTAAGLYDSLEEIAAECQRLGLWFHVDGAHGAGALVSPKHRHLMRGVALADSLVWDAHKMLATPALCAAVLMKDHKHLDQALQQEASYLFHDKDEPGFDFMPRTIECTKTAMGLRFFMVLATLGEEGLARHVDALFQLGKTAQKVIEQRPDFSVPVAPECNIICFQYGDDSCNQLDLRTRLLREGMFYITTTLFGGKRYLRLALMNPVTGEATLNGMLDALERLAQGRNNAGI